MREVEVKLKPKSKTRVADIIPDYPLPPIRSGERDIEMHLRDKQWASSIPSEAWRSHNGVLGEPWEAVKSKSALWRRLSVDARVAGANSEAARTVAVWNEGLKSEPNGQRSVRFAVEDYKEYMLRFPSAPMYGLTNRAHFDQARAEKDGDWVHSFRVILPYQSEVRESRIRRIYVLHNGLNERQDYRLYYELAAVLIGQRDDVACLVWPFPGHLSRYRYPAFAETPLERYLDDGGHLFRQYLRYMVETRWLLSVLSTQSGFHVPAGADLLLESWNAQDSMLNDNRLSKAISDDWWQLAEASDRRVNGEGTLKRDSSIDAIVKQSVTDLRDILGLRPRSGTRSKSERDIHVVGYSLGGFAARSIFMCWPFLISSCSTLLSGGALRELAPTAFSHPEEWQTVLHSLRMELDNAMINGKYAHTPARQTQAAGTRPPPATGARGPGKIVGLDAPLFSTLQRIFYGVFQQEYRGSFQSRLAAYRKRMLFIVGGNDPIVRSRAVLESGPPDGINLLQIGGLQHFLPMRAEGPDEQTFKHSWMPEIGRQIANIADQGAHELAQARGRVALNRQGFLARGKEGTAEDIEFLPIKERLRIQGDGALDNEQFDLVMNDMFARAGQKAREPVNDADGLPKWDPGVLFVLGNEAFAFLLNPEALLERAAMLYHDATAMERYVRRVEARRKFLAENLNRVCLVLSVTYTERLIEPEDEFGLPSQAETVASRGIRDPMHEVTVANKTLKDWSKQAPQSVRVFDAKAARDDEFNRLLKAASAQLAVEGAEDVTSLPDCLVWLDHENVRGDQKSMSKAVHELASFLGGLNRETIGNISQREALRIVSMSRARFNPRYRGRVMGAQENATQQLLLHAGLCIVGSKPWVESQPGLAHVDDRHP